MRRLLLAASATALSLALVGGAGAANGGFTPPDGLSPNGEAINQAYYLVAGVTLAVFLLVEVSLVVFIVRFRSRGRGREVEGPQITGHTRLEVIWTIVPVLALTAIATFVFIKLPVIRNDPARGTPAERLNVRVEARQFYWRFVYPNGAVSIDRLVVPAGRYVILTIVSPDVDHSFWVPAFGPKTDAIPGRVNHQWFKVERTGFYRGVCAELCGIQHAMMLFTAEVRPEAAYRDWVTGQRLKLRAPNTQLGSEEWTGVCAKCHYLHSSGETLIGPNLKGNPTLTDPKALGLLVRNGRGEMPAVGKGWSDVEVNSLVRYFKQQDQGAQSGR